VNSAFVIYSIGVIHQEGGSPVYIPLDLGTLDYCMVICHKVIGTSLCALLSTLHHFTYTRAFRKVTSIYFRQLM
jgi:hypothetical protein